MSVIHILDEVTANQIAAGEVVERPVNAVKELIENSVDAGANEIEVEIADGGMSYIRVTDNGTGMAPEDVKLSVIRHATSKISTVENIYHIASLGFRGEALPSIMSVSRATITTRRPEDAEGTAVHVIGGEVGDPMSTGAPAGTTVEVRELFYNVPARKKFLKSERAESSRINSMVGKLALANASIAFRLINNGRIVIETPGNGRLLDAISALYGIDTAGEMLHVESNEEGYFLEGFISKPSVLKSSRRHQTIIINRRVVESAAITKAVDNAYHSLLPKNGYPLMTLVLTVPPDVIDVNVHPQKREIKFDDEKRIFRFIYHAVLNTLTTQSTPDTIAKEIIKTPGHHVMNDGDLDIEQVTVTDKAGERNTTRLYDEESLPRETINKERQEDLAYIAHHEKNNKIRENFTPTTRKAAILSNESVFVKSEEQESVQTHALFESSKENIPIVPLGQVANCFILCQHGDDLFIIDQHAAHERVRYDRLAERTDRISVQTMLIPQLMHVSPEDLDLLLEKEEEIKLLGITFEQAGADVIRIIGAPEDFSEGDMQRVIKDLLIAFQSADLPSPATMRHRMLAYAACRGAIKRGDSLNIRQMKELIADLFHTTRPFVCPHGRPTIVKFTAVELGRLFKR